MSQFVLDTCRQNRFCEAQVSLEDVSLDAAVLLWNGSLFNFCRGCGCFYAARKEKEKAFRSQKPGDVSMCITS